MKTKQLLLTLLIACLISPAIAQTYNFNYMAAGYADAQSVESSLVVNGNELITVGHVPESISASFPQKTDILVVKTDLNGNVLWSQRYGGNNISERGNALEITYDGLHVIVVGTAERPGIISDPANPNFDVLAFKVKISNGRVIWANHYGQTVGREEGFMIEKAIDFTLDPNPSTLVPPLYTIVGSSVGTTTEGFERIYAVGILDNGTQFWAKRYLNGNNFPFFSVRPTSFTRTANRLILAGIVSEVNRPTRVFTYGIDVYSGALTDKFVRYEIPAGYNANGVAISRSVFSGYGLAFTLSSFNGNCLSTVTSALADKIAVISLNSNRKVLWGNTYYQGNNNAQGGVGIDPFVAPLNNYGFTVAANTRSTTGINRAAFLQVDLFNGNVVQFRKYNTFTFTNSQHVANSMIPAFGGGYYIKSLYKTTSGTGYSVSRVDPNGYAPCSNVESIARCGFKSEGKTVKFEPVNAGNRTFKYLPQSFLNVPINGCFLSTEHDGPGEETIVNDGKSLTAGSITNATVYPSPLSASAATFTVKFDTDLYEVPATIRVVNALGQEVLTERLDLISGTNQLELDATLLSKGLHIVTVMTEGQVLHQLKLIKE